MIIPKGITGKIQSLDVTDLEFGKILLKVFRILFYY